MFLNIVVYDMTLEDININCIAILRNVLLNDDIK